MVLDIAPTGRPICKTCHYPPWGCVAAGTAVAGADWAPSVPSGLRHRHEQLGQSPPTRRERITRWALTGCCAPVPTLLSARPLPTLSTTAGIQHPHWLTGRNRLHVGLFRPDPYPSGTGWLPRSPRGRSWGLVMTVLGEIAVAAVGKSDGRRQLGTWAISSNGSCKTSLLMAHGGS